MRVSVTVLEHEYVHMNYAYIYVDNLCDIKKEALLGMRMQVN